jgi:hypothetical protein
LPKATSKRRRVIPVPAQITMRGSCDFFDESDVTVMADCLRQPPVVEASRVVEQLNFLSEQFLLRYALHNVPTPDSKTAEWCQALERDVDALMQTLGVPDKGYPERQMDLSARTVLTNMGTGLVLSDLHYQLMRLGGDAWEVLDRVPAALWALRKIAAHAAGEYGRRARQRGVSKNARQPQNAYLLQGLVLLFDSCFGVSAPPERPNPDGPFCQAADLVRLRLIQRIEGGHDFTDQGTDRAAARRLRSFTPKAIASLWVREGERLTANLAEYRSTMTRGGDQSVPE